MTLVLLYNIFNKITYNLIIIYIRHIVTYYFVIILKGEVIQNNISGIEDEYKVRKNVLKIQKANKINLTKMEKLLRNK